MNLLEDAQLLYLVAACSYNMLFDPTLTVEDPDGDIVRCRWAVGEAECYDVCNAFPNATLDEVS